MIGVLGSFMCTANPSTFIHSFVNGLYKKITNCGMSRIASKFTKKFFYNFEKAQWKNNEFQNKLKKA